MDTESGLIYFSTLQNNAATWVKKVAISKAHNDYIITTYMRDVNLKYKLGLNSYVLVNIIHSLVTIHHLSTSFKNPADAQSNNN